VADVASTLNLNPEPAAAYQRHVDSIVYSAHRTESTPAKPQGHKVRHRTVEEIMIDDFRAISARREAEFAGADDIIARHCEQEWPDDFNMRAYCMQQQQQALENLKRDAPAGVPDDVFLKIRQKCAREWPNDFNMRHYCQQQQIAAYLGIQKKRP
jgi:hypothetical protein